LELNTYPSATFINSRGMSNYNIIANLVKAKIPMPLVHALEYLNTTAAAIETLLATL
jgi:hypothetical protein